MCVCVGGGGGGGGGGGIRPKVNRGCVPISYINFTPKHFFALHRHLGTRFWKKSQIFVQDNFLVDFQQVRDLPDHCQSTLIGRLLWFLTMNFTVLKIFLRWKLKTGLFFWRFILIWFLMYNERKFISQDSKYEFHHGIRRFELYPKVYFLCSNRTSCDRKVHTRYVVFILNPQYHNIIMLRKPIIYNVW